MRVVSAPATPPTTISFRQQLTLTAVARDCRQGGISAKHKQAGWNNGYLLNVLGFGTRLPWPHGRAHPPSDHAFPHPVDSYRIALVCTLMPAPCFPRGFQATHSIRHASRNLRRRLGTRLGAKFIVPRSALTGLSSVEDRLSTVAGSRGIARPGSRRGDGLIESKLSYPRKPRGDCLNPRRHFICASKETALCHTPDCQDVDFCNSPARPGQH